MIRWTDADRDYLVATAATLTPAQQAAALGCSIKAVHGKRYCMRRAGRLADGAVPNWTQEDLERARILIRDGKSPAQVGAALGRSANAVLNQLTKHGVNVRQELARAGGYDVRELAAAFGVGRDVIIDWIRRGFLHATRRRVLRQDVYAISYADALAFVATHGGYAVLRPSARFAGAVEDARRAFAQRYIGRAALSSALCISDTTLGHWPTRFGFPKAIMFGGRSYYERSAVDAFLARHPALAPASWGREGRG